MNIEKPEKKNASFELRQAKQSEPQNASSEVPAEEKPPQLPSISKEQADVSGLHELPFEDAKNGE